ncbi:hypothetical protein SAMN02799624_03358 [Paenibacillus sp. UNC496MF]|uniref:hypothetical protein n=1 Tax=Paenibacillus sp. UNC496MF TaxID=1502753 RepID=UPI0008E67E4B|nr:hypothetical protein [Paenibacillus sp. UNC496MF]SFJ12328.1 hypothetical protein SAMN02799624_03358 [Paenibacillus sp. UNC496MF]
MIGTGGRILLALAAAIIAGGCGGDGGYLADKRQPAEGKATAMPADMPADFDFELKYGYGGGKNEVDTYDDTITKDLIVNGTATADLALSEQEMRDIYARMREIDVMGKKKLEPENPGCGQEPHTDDSWTVTAAGETKSMHWSTEHCDITDDARQLADLRYVRGVAESKAAYKALPEAEGGYD